MVRAGSLRLRRLLLERVAVDELVAMVADAAGVPGLDCRRLAGPVFGGEPAEALMVCVQMSA